MQADADYDPRLTISQLHRLKRGTFVRVAFRDPNPTACAALCCLSGWWVGFSNSDASRDGSVRILIDTIGRDVRELRIQTRSSDEGVVLAERLIGPALTGRLTLAEIAKLRKGDRVTLSVRFEPTDRSPREITGAIARRPTRNSERDGWDFEVVEDELPGKLRRCFCTDVSTRTPPDEGLTRERPQSLRSKIESQLAVLPGVERELPACIRAAAAELGDCFARSVSPAEAFERAGVAARCAIERALADLTDDEVVSLLNRVRQCNARAAVID